MKFLIASVDAASPGVTRMVQSENRYLSGRVNSDDLLLPARNREKGDQNSTGMDNVADARMQELLINSLRESPYRELKNIRVQASGKSVCLTGMVSSFFLKQMAQETVRPIFPNQRIYNHIQVKNRVPKPR